MNNFNKFDVKKLEKLNNPERAKMIDVNKIWDCLQLKNTDVLADIGAGTGFFALLFAEKLSRGKIFACDVLDVMVDCMKQNISSPSIFPVKTEENNIPLPDNSIDFLYMINLHHELDNPDKILSECFRVLKQGGKIAIIDWKKIPMDFGPPLEIRVEEQDVIQVLTKIGFKKPVNNSYFEQNFFISARK